jgi:hypothetical protein
LNSIANSQKNKGNKNKNKKTLDSFMMHVSPPSKGKIATSNKAKRKKNYKPGYTP